MPDQNLPTGTPEVLDRLASAAMAHIVELIRALPDGVEEEQGALATVVLAEILARTLTLPDAPFVAEIATAVLCAHKLAWRVVAVS